MNEKTEERPEKTENGRNHTGSKVQVVVLIPGLALSDLTALTADCVTHNKC